MGWDGIGRDGMGWDGIEWGKGRRHRMAWDGMGLVRVWWSGKKLKGDEVGRKGTRWDEMTFDGKGSDGGRWNRKGYNWAEKNARVGVGRREVMRRTGLVGWDGLDSDGVG